MSDFFGLSEKLSIALEEVQRKNGQIQSSKRTLRLYDAHIQKQRSKIKSLQTQNKKLKIKVEQTGRLQRMLVDKQEIIKKYKAKIKALEQQCGENQKEMNQTESLTESLEWSSIKKIVEDLKQSKSENREEFTINHQFNIDDDEQSDSLQFVQGVKLQGESEYPTSHRKILAMINEYYFKLMPSFKMNFLNILAAETENKLDQIHDFYQQMEGVWDQ